ncbi:MAG: acyltransferase [Chitinophagaceae bacterium]|nr:acyltransferase [Chitinophagaceae bacterium]
MKSRLENIQHLRGIAAMLVVFVHFPTELQRFCGAIGVDIFFFISGFIIYTSIEKSGYHNRPFEFLKKRLLRVIPLYFAVMALYLLMHFLLDAVRESSISPTFSTMDVVKSFLFIPNVHDNVYQDPIVFLGWSLNFEMLFYLITVICIAIFSKKYFLPLLLILFSLGMTGVVSGGFENVIIDQLTSPFLFYFCIGLLIGRYQQQISDRLAPFSEVLFFSSLYLLFVVMLGKDYGYEHVGITRERVVYDGVSYPRFLIWGIPSLLVFLSYFSFSQKYRISSRFLNELGNRSYSIYLLQIFFIQFLYEAGFLFNSVGKTILSFALMGILVWFSGLSFKYFEKRFHK